MKKFIILIFSILTFTNIDAQTADIIKGCAPLDVAFTSTALSDYLWDFGDANSSILATPSHVYTAPGIYTVELFEGVGGIKIGELEITVLALPEYKITADPPSGCGPLTVSFMNTSIVDPEMTITGYLWDFGDGGSSTLEHPTHTYSEEGTFSVSLRISSDLGQCTETETFKDFITVTSSIIAGFSLDKSVICTAPATFTISNNTIDGSGYTYAWDFDNGISSTEYNPNTITYNEEGKYDITLVVDNGLGCMVTLQRTVVVGKPKIDIDFPDTLCVNLEHLIVNSSDGNQFAWSFGNGSSPQSSTLRTPQITYSTGGNKIVTFSAIASDNCKADTFFTVVVEDPSAAFTIDPMTACSEPAIYNFIHPDPNFKTYSWYIPRINTTFLDDSDASFTYVPPLRDSFYINRSDTFKVHLFIETYAGCKANDSLYYIHRAPEAHFVPSTSRGCAPLTVVFDEKSISIENIISWKWLFADGTTADATSADDMTHTFTDPGEYFVRLIIENAAGCQDTSGSLIYVGEKLTSDFTIDKSEICLYDTVQFSAINTDPRIDAYHFETDEGRISHCYKETNASHAFIHSPGTYPVTLNIEYNGCFNNIDNGSTITVNGSKSRIRYMTNCSDPLTVMLQDSSVNATSSIWIMNGDTISMDTIAENFINYTFDSTGDYEVFLLTDDDTNCPADTSSVDLKIRAITADFDLPEYVCAYETYRLDASTSIDVDKSCSKGLNWYGVSIRPRMLDVDTVTAAWLPGKFSVRLITEDVNGCKDTLEKESIALDLEPNFVFDKERFCFPQELSFTDLSTADTTIVEWEWDFGENEQNPTKTFVLGSGQSVPQNLFAQLVVTDALGCKDSITLSIPVNQPKSNISFDPGQTVCLGETIHFTATDFTEEGSFLNFNWAFLSTGGNSIEQNPDYVVTVAGDNDVRLTITEEATGCHTQYIQNIVGIQHPIADFSSFPDIDKELCANEIIVFTNQSFLDGPGGYLWNFGNGVTTQAVNPSSKFDKGIFDIELIVSSIYGCSDTISKSVTLVGPEAQFAIDKTKVCQGEELVFTMTDTVDVAHYLWDFGDGYTTENINPTTHEFSYYPENGRFDVVLEITSKDGCKESIILPIQVFKVDADFEINGSLCQGDDVEFVNLSEPENFNFEYSWDFGNGETSDNTNPTTSYETEGEYDVLLTIFHADSGCSVPDMQTITITPFPELIVLDSLICSEDSIYIRLKNYNSQYIYEVDPNVHGNIILPNGIIYIDPSNSLNYTITAIDTASLCATEKEVSVDLALIPEIPNIFSPNNDDINDYFDIVVPEKFRELIEPSLFKVFNRWGNKLYDNEFPLLGWDGKLGNGDYAPAEVYTYVIQVNGVTYKGTVTLIL